LPHLLQGNQEYLYPIFVGPVHIKVWVADAAKLTHQHPLGFIPAAFTAHVIYRLASDKNPLIIL